MEATPEERRQPAPSTNADPNAGDPTVAAAPEQHDGPATPGPGDDTILSRYGAALADAVDAALGPWMAAAVAARLGPLSPEMERAVAAATPEAVATVGGRLRDLLALDLDDQWTNPLSIIRQAVAYPTAILAGAGVTPVERDATDSRVNPDDIYALAPAAFADLGPEVHERGLEWGAAKAHVHLTRRRQGSRR